MGRGDRRVVIAIVVLVLVALLWAVSRRDVEPVPASPATATWTATVEPSATWTATVEPSATWTATVEPSATWTATVEPSATWTATVEPLPTWTATVEPPLELPETGGSEADD